MEGVAIHTLSCLCIPLRHMLLCFSLEEYGSSLEDLLQGACDNQVTVVMAGACGCYGIQKALLWLHFCLAGEQRQRQYSSLVQVEGTVEVVLDSRC